MIGQPVAGGARVSWAVLLVYTGQGDAPEARLDSAWTNLQDAELRVEELWRLFAVWRVPMSAILGRVVGATAPEPPGEPELEIVWPVKRGAET